MKVLNVGLVVVLLGVGLSCSMQAKTIVYNQSNYEIKVVAEIAGSPSWIAYPSGVRKEGGNYILDNSKGGIMPGTSDFSRKDLANVKKNWIVWAKIDGIWKNEPVVTSNQRATGGIIHPVKAHVTNSVNENGEPVFAISVEQGW